MTKQLGALAFLFPDPETSEINSDCILNGRPDWPEMREMSQRKLPAKKRSKAQPINASEESRWPISYIPSEVFFDPKETIAALDLRCDRPADQEAILNVAAAFYAKTFNEAGADAGLATAWTVERAKSQLIMRLKKPGVAFLLVDKNNGRKPIAIFIMEIAPGLNGPRGVELDVALDADYRAQGLGLKIIFYGFNKIARLAEDCHAGVTAGTSRKRKIPLQAMTAETYKLGHPQEWWDEVGFRHINLLLTSFWPPAVKEDLGDIEIFVINHENLARLRQIKNFDGINHSLVAGWDKERFPSLVDFLDGYLNALKGQASPFVYIAIDKTKAADDPKSVVAVFGVTSAIRREGLSLADPWCITRRPPRPAANLVTTGKLVRALFAQAGEDLLNDARNAGVIDTSGSITIEYGAMARTGYFDRFLWPARLDCKFYGIVATDFRHTAEKLLGHILKKDPYAPIYETWQKPANHRHRPKTDLKIG